MATGHGHILQQGFGEDDLLALVDALYPVSKKYLHLGLQIGVKKEEIDKVKYADPTMRLLEVIKLRLRVSEPLTWSMIDQALRSSSINESQLADSIQRDGLKSKYEKASVKDGKSRRVREDGPSSALLEYQFSAESYTDPSPSSENEESLCESDLGAIDNAIHPVCNKYVFLGLLIGVSRRDIEIIEARYEDPSRCLLEILSLRLKEAKPLTWGAVDKALRSRLINESRLADEILENKSWPRFEVRTGLEHVKQETSAGNAAKEEDGDILFHHTSASQTQETEFNTHHAVTCEGKTKRITLSPTISKVDEVLKDDSEPVKSLTSSKRHPEEVGTRTELDAAEEETERAQGDESMLSGNDNRRTKWEESEKKEASSINGTANAPFCGSKDERIPEKPVFSKAIKSGTPLTSQATRSVFRHDDSKRNTSETDSSSSSETDNESSPERDKLRGQLTPEHNKKLTKIFKRFFGELCCAITSPAKTAAQLQRQPGLISQSLMKNILRSPESEMDKTISLVSSLGKKIKSRPDKILTLITGLLEIPDLEEVGRRMLTDTGTLFNIVCVNCTNVVVLQIKCALEEQPQVIHVLLEM